MELPRIAWIDDDNNLIETNLAVLNPENGFYFDIATFRVLKDSLDLRRARTDLTTRAYDLIMLDDQMLRQGVYPENDLEVGEQLLLDLRGQDANKTTPVIMYTEDINQRRIEDYRTMGANLWIPKKQRFIWRDTKNSRRLCPIKEEKRMVYESFIEQLAHLREYSEHQVFS
jgi:CheY-like chemotaxis protein